MGRVSEYFRHLNDPRADHRRFTHWTPTPIPITRQVTKAVASTKPAAPEKPIVAKVRPRIHGAVHPVDVCNVIFGRCRKGSHIAIGSVRPTTRNREPHQAALALVPVEARKEWLPEVFAYAVENMQVFMVQSLHERAKFQGSDRLIGQHASICWFGAKNENVAELTTIALDLDAYNENMDAGKALGCAVAMAVNHEIPMPALAAHSGRGAYLFWLLRDEETTAPPIATRDNIGAWQNVAAALHGRMKHLGSDPASATTLAKWYKRPSVIDPKSGNEVTYLTFGGGDLGNLRLWKLSELQNELGAYSARLDDTKKRTLSKPIGQRQPSKRSAAVWRLRAADVEKLNAYRGGIRKGHRGVAAWIYYRCVRAALRAEADKTLEARDEVNRLAYEKTVELVRTFNQPLSHKELGRQVKEPKNNPQARYWRNATLAAKLDVTAEEARAAGLTVILPADMDEARQAARRTEAAAARIERQNHDAEIADLIALGLKDAEIARRVGVNRGTVGRHRDKLKAAASVPTPALLYADQAVATA